MSARIGNINTASLADNSLAGRIMRGAAWIIGGRIIVRALGLINTLILARLLVPEDFGLVAIGVTVMQLLQNITDIGVSRTVVKFRDAGRAQYETLFTISLIRGAAVSAIMLAAAMLADNFYADPRVTVIFFGIAIVPLFHALMNPRFFEFERDLDFTKQFSLEAADKLIGVAVSISIAIIFRSYWAIILGLVSGAFAQMVMSWLMRPYRPRLSLSAVGEIGGFAGWLAGLSFVAALNNKLDVLFLGKFVSPADVGAFFVGGSVASLPSGEIAIPMARAIYPGLSELQGDATAMRNAYLRAAEALALIAMPASFGVAFIAHDLVALLLGSGWERAALMLQYFSPAAGLGIIFYATNAYALALGRARLIFLREVLVFFIRTPIFIIAAVLYGLVGAAIACAIGLLVIAALNAGLYARLSGGGPLEPLWRARRSLVGVAAMATYFLLFRGNLVAITDLPLAGRLCTDALIGAGLFSTTVYVLWRLEGAPKSVERLVINQANRVIARFRRDDRALS